MNASGQTATTTLTSGETDLSWDAGLQLVAFPSVSIDKILVSSSPVYLTDLVTYTLRIENTGPTILTVIPLEDIYRNNFV